MPLFHFHLVTRSDRERIGSLNLPDEDAIVPAGLELATQILAGASCRKAKDKGWTIQATNHVGALVYSFEISRQAGDRVSSGYVH
jgi:hypothetical protein